MASWVCTVAISKAATPSDAVETSNPLDFESPSGGLPYPAIVLHQEKVPGECLHGSSAHCRGRSFPEGQAGQRYPEVDTGHAPGMPQPDTAPGSRSVVQDGG